MKKHLRLLGALCMFLIAVNTSQAQIRVISGNVKDSTTEKGMVGVAVLVKGTNTGTYTDQDGNYSLALPSNATAIEFSFLGYKTATELIGTSNTIDLNMQPDVYGLKQVVFTALGISQEKEALGYSTQTVSSDELNTSGTGNTLSELEGKVAGLNVISSSGDPGSAVFMQLRGTTSLTGNNQPLMVVDGVPIDNSVNAYDPVNTFFQASGPGGEPLGGAGPDNRGTDINPNDIASITVLKGPAASALYGIKANAGAIIITTKKGNGGKKGPTIEFNTSESMSMVNKLPGLQNQFAQGSSVDAFSATGYDATPTYYGPTDVSFNGLLEGGKASSWGPAIDTLAWNGVSNNYDVHGNIVGKSDPTAKIPVTPYDNVDEFFRTGFTEDNNLALSGGNDKNSYRFSIGNVNQSGIIPLSGYDRTNVSLSGHSALSSKLSASAGINYVNSSSDKVQQGSDVSGIMIGLLRTPPTFDNSNGLSDPVTNSAAYILPDSTERDYRGGRGYDNPYWSINRNPYHQDVNRIYGFGQVDYKPLTWLNITYRLGADEYSQDTKQAFDILSSSFYGSGAVYLIDYFNMQINSDIIATAQHDFSKNLSGTLTLGQNFFDLQSSNRLQQGTGLAIPDFFDLANATSYFSSEAESEIRRSAWYGEGLLAYKSMLFLTLTGRDETSSTLPAANDNFFYPSADLGFVFTEPLGLSNNKIFPYGKLRVSFAQVGNDAPAQGLETYYIPAAINDGFTPGDNFPFNGVAGYSISSLISVIGNPNLKPETTNSFETGLDLAFLQNRISLSGTYYYEHTTNGIFTVPVSYTTGFASELINAATLTNNGVELTLNVTPIKQKNNGFRWDLTFNWSKNDNMVDALAPGIQDLFIGGFTNGGIYAVPGQPFGVIKGSMYQRSDANNMNSPLLIDDNPSDLGYGMPQEASQTGIIGNIQPNWLGSVISTFSYKGFSLGFEIDVRDGGQIWDGTQGAIDYFGTGAATANRGQTTVFNGVLGHIAQSGPYAGEVVHWADGVEVPGAGSQNNITATYNQYYWQNIGSSFIGPTEADVEPGGFTRLRQVSLTYTFPKSIVQKMHLFGLSVTIFANNALLATKYPGVDPETSLTGASNSQGIDYFNNPDTKSFGIRLNVTL